MGTLTFELSLLLASTPCLPGATLPVVLHGSLICKGVDA